MTLADAYLCNDDIAHAALDGIQEYLSRFNLKATDETLDFLWDEIYSIAKHSHVIES